jgi:DNA mismatch repair protein MLH3
MIRQLERGLIQKVRSGIAITSLTQLVEELAQNSIDADATKIEINFDAMNGFVEIQDNGIGMGWEDLQKCGNRYSTSKLSTLEALSQIRSFGFRGEAIASIANVSIVLIHSRSRDSNDTHDKWMKDGKVLTIGTATRGRASAGTTTTVRELFHNLPVRQRYMILGAIKQALRAKQVLVRLALMHHGISFVLHDACHGRQLLSIAAGRSPLSVFRTVYGEKQASIMEEVDFKAHGQGYEMQLQGYMSRPGQGNRNKEQQLFFVNRRYISDTCGAKLHQRINECMKKFCQKPSQSQQRAQASYGSRGVPTAQLSPALGNFSCFFINLTLPPEVCDITYAPEKTTINFRDEERVGTFIDEALVSFLNVTVPEQNGTATHASVPISSSEGDRAGKPAHVATLRAKHQNTVSDGGALPPEWETRASTSHCGVAYYVNINTGETQWHRPESACQAITTKRKQNEISRTTSVAAAIYRAHRSRRPLEDELDLLPLSDLEVVPEDPVLESTAAPQTLWTVCIAPYKEAVAITGDTAPLRDALMVLGGNWNQPLSAPPGVVRHLCRFSQ